MRHSILRLNLRDNIIYELDALDVASKSYQVLVIDVLCFFPMVGGERFDFWIVMEMRCFCWLLDELQRIYVQYG